MVALISRCVLVCCLAFLSTSATSLHRDDSVQVYGDHVGIMRHEPRQSSQMLPTGTVAVLVKATKKDLEELQTMLMSSLISNVRFQTAVTIMFEGDRRLVEAATLPLQGHSLLHPVQLVDVSKYFAPTKDEVAMLAGPDTRMLDLGFGMGYRKMCEFWAVHVHTLPALAPYQYLWRLDTDSRLTEAVTSNLYQAMKSHDSVFGYLLLQDANPLACQGLQHATEAFYAANPQFSVVSPEAEMFLKTYEERRCPHWNTNFQLMDLDFFRGSDTYASHMAYLSEAAHGFVKYRWGDHIVQTLSVLLQVPPTRTLCMQAWVPGYVHQGAEPNCDPKLLEPPLVGQSSYGSGVR